MQLLARAKGLSLLNLCSSFTDRRNNRRKVNSQGIQMFHHVDPTLFPETLLRCVEHCEADGVALQSAQ